jgi:hypothetical protein
MVSLPKNVASVGSIGARASARKPTDEHQRTVPRGHRELVTVIGHAATISAGEWITANREWVNDRTHGQQFKARFLRTSAPTSADGIENTSHPA